MLIMCLCDIANQKMESSSEWIRRPCFNRIISSVLQLWLRTRKSFMGSLEMSSNQVKIWCPNPIFHSLYLKLYIVLLTQQKPFFKPLLLLRRRLSLLNLKGMVWCLEIVVPSLDAWCSLLLVYSFVRINSFPSFFNYDDMMREVEV